MATMQFSNGKSMQYRKLSTDIDKHGVKTVTVAIEQSVYDTMIECEFSGFCFPDCDNNGVITVSVLSAKDGSKWQHVMHDELIDFVE